MDLYCNSFSLLDPWEKCGSFGFSLGVCPTDTARCSSLLGCLVSEDECLRKYAISDGSATAAKARGSATSSPLPRRHAWRVSVVWPRHSNRRCQKC